jgi:Phosphate transport (Pho88)
LIYTNKTMDDTFPLSLVMPVLGYYIASQIDLTEKLIEAFLILAYCIEVLGSVYVLYKTRATIFSSNDETKLSYYARDFWGKKKKLKQRDLVETTHKKYDLEQWRNEAIKSSFALFITGFLFFSSQLHSVLLLGVLTLPFSLTESKVIQIHFFKYPATNSRSRPFGDPASLVGVISNQVKTLKKDYEEISTGRLGKEEAEKVFVEKEADLIRQEIQETKKRQSSSHRSHT